MTQVRYSIPHSHLRQEGHRLHRLLKILQHRVRLPQLCRKLQALVCRMRPAGVDNDHFVALRQLDSCPQQQPLSVLRRFWAQESDVHPSPVRCCHPVERPQ